MIWVYEYLSHGTKIQIQTFYNNEFRISLATEWWLDYHHLTFCLIILDTTIQDSCECPKKRKYIRSSSFGSQCFHKLIRIIMPFDH